MRDVAERVGLSRQLVSIVLRGAPGASDDSRARVLAAAAEMGYYPDDSARMLRRRRSGQLGVLFTMHQPFEVDLVDALYLEASARGYTLLLGSMGPKRSQQDALSELMRQRIEALLALDAGGGAEVFDALPTGVPTLLLGGPVATEPHDSVRVENEAGVALAVDHLAALGHRRIAYVGPSEGANAQERLSAFRSVTEARGVEAEVLPSDYTESGGAQAARTLRTRLAVPGAELPTGFVCINDHCAIGMLQTLVRDGAQVPEEFSIVGFDDSTSAALPFVELTSVRPDPEHMARLAIDTVLARLDDPLIAPSTTLVSPTLSVRGSTGPPRS